MLVFGLGLVSVRSFRFSILCVFLVLIDYVLLVLFASVVLGI